MSVPPYAIAIVGERIATPPHLYANTGSCPVSIGSSIISDRYAIRGPMIAVLAIMSTTGWPCTSVGHQLPGFVRTSPLIIP